MLNFMLFTSPLLLVILIGILIVFSSSQGISLIPDPNGEALIIAADGDGLYYVPLTPK